jgi:hypothetical protein
MKDLVSALSITENEATLKAALRGIGTIVELKSATVKLIEGGLTVQDLIDRVAVDIEVSDSLTIDSPELMAEAQAIAGRLATVCADNGAIEAERAAITSPFFDLQKKIKAGYDAPRIYIAGKLDALKGKILAYHNEQQRIAREAAETQRLQREADARAAAEREATAITEANALIQQAAVAQANGSEITAAALVSEASTRMDTARQEAEQSVASLHTRIAPVSVAAANGTRENWTVEVIDLRNLILHVADRLRGGDASLLPLLVANQAALNAKARLEKAGYSVPGTRASSAQSLSVRKSAVAA